MDINEALKPETEEDQIVQSLVVHKTAGPPYFENEPKLPNSRPKKNRPKRPKRPKTTTTTTTRPPIFITTQRPIVQQRVIDKECFSKTFL